jgi:hypothetical protein
MFKELLINNECWYSLKNRGGSVDTFEHDVKIGKADEKMVEHVREMFRFKGICPTSSCQGHSKNQKPVRAYIMFSCVYPLRDNVWRALTSTVSELKEIDNYCRIQYLQEYSGNLLERYFVYLFTNDKLDEAMKILYLKLEEEGIYRVPT